MVENFNIKGLLLLINVTVTHHVRLHHIQISNYSCNDKILQAAIYTFHTLSMYKFIVGYKSFLNNLKVCTVLECYPTSKIDIWIETNSPL